jgi:tetratricopeptide (TPR) repeat protein
MKKYLIICSLGIGLISLNLKAQNTESAINQDSIKNRILEILRQENLDCYYYAGTYSHPNNEEYLQNRPYYGRLKSPKSVSIVDNTVNLTFKKGKRSVSLLQKIKRNNEYVIFFVPPAGCGWTKGGIIWGDLFIPDLKSQNELIQLQNKLLFNSYWGDFDKIVKDFNSLAVKPAVTEEQRKYIVQANAMNAKKDFSTATQLFNKVIATDPTAYPAAYFNLALISAQTGNYLYAIVNMKKYLLLVPEAEDARDAQDKIYEWEVETDK